MKSTRPRNGSSNGTKRSPKRKHRGSKFEDFLAEEGLLEDCRVEAVKAQLAQALAQYMAAKRISKSELAQRLHTSRTGVERLLDPVNQSITLHSIAKAAKVMGKQLRLSLA